jgi:hypothetical protein
MIFQEVDKAAHCPAAALGQDHIEKTSGSINSITAYTQRATCSAAKLRKKSASGVPPAGS